MLSCGPSLLPQLVPGRPPHGRSEPLSNIVGSALGSVGIRFVLMNHFGTKAILIQLAAARYGSGGYYGDWSW
jgi:hypothetical protein